MSDGFGCLLLGEPVIHRAIEMVGDLLDLAAGDQRGDGNEAAVTRRKIGTQPQVAEQIVRRVLHEAGRCLAELVSDARCAISLCLFIQWKGRGLDCWELIGPNTMLGEDFAHRADGSHRFTPAGIIGQMRNRFRDFGWLHAVFALDRHNN